jgi:putative glutamine amidotransferase
VVSNGSEREGAPLIGLSTYVERARFGAWDEHAALLPVSYLHAVASAGGYGALLPPSPLGPAAVLAALDGLVITGGPDVDPRAYGAQAHPQTDDPREERDSWELALCKGAVDLGLPLLAICRGLQVLNVALGGTLHQHLPDVLGNEAHRVAMGQMAPNKVALRAGSTVGSLLGTETEGLCHHHQAVDRLGAGVEVVGFAADGTVEAVEVMGHGFALGVQWHPEDNPADNRLFVALVGAAERYRGARLQRAGEPAPSERATAERAPTERVPAEPATVPSRS